MRILVAVAAIVVGVIVLSGVVAAADNGRDHSGDTVRAQSWANDVCGSVGSWEGDLKAIREEMRHNNYAARRSDGYTGDSIEERVTVREAVDRGIRATEDTLQEGIKRAGIPDANGGARAASIMHDWAQRTEVGLRAAKAEMRQKPTSVAEAFASLGPPIDALARSAVDGRRAFQQVAALDPALADAIEGSRNCGRLSEKSP